MNSQLTKKHDFQNVKIKNIRKTANLVFQSKQNEGVRKGDINNCDSER